MDNWFFDNIVVFLLATISIFEMVNRATRALAEKRYASTNQRQSQMNR